MNTAIPTPGEGREGNFPISLQSGEAFNRIVKLSMIPDALQVTAIIGLINNREYLEQKGLFPKKNGQVISDMGELTTFVADIFASVRQMETAGVPSEDIYTSEQYKDVLYLLILARKIIPAVAGDWEVDRGHQAEYELCLRSFDILEDTLAEKYPFVEGDEDPFFRTLEKGIGNGAAMRIRLKNNSSKPSGKRWEQYGIADALYYPIEPVLWNFIRPELREDKAVQRFVKCLGAALRRELKELWFQAPGNTLQQWIPKEKFFDVNILYDLFRDPGPWLQKWYDPETGKYKTSRQFEYDQERQLDFATHKFFLELGGYPQAQQEAILRGVESQALQEQRSHVDRKSRVLERLTREIKEYFSKGKNSLSSNLSSDHCQVFLRWREIIRIFIDSDADIEPTFESIAAYLDESAAIFHEELLRIAMVEEQRKRQMSSKPPPRQGCLERIFTDEFVHGIRNPAQRKNLNRDVPVYLHNMVVDVFENIPFHFPPNSFFLIVALYSDSHEDDETFKEDIRANLSLLKPGGCIITNGIRRSYALVRRFEEIKEVLGNNPHYKVEVFLDRKNRNAWAIVIQRSHLNGFFTVQDKNKIFHDEICLKRLDVVMERADLRIMNAVRRQVLSAVNNNVDFFRSLHEKINADVYKFLVGAALQEYQGDLQVEDWGTDEWGAVNFEGGYPEELYRNVIRRIQHGEWTLPEATLEQISQTVFENARDMLQLPLH